MADPFGIIGLLGVAAQFIQIAVDFGLDWKDAPAETKAFIAELQGLQAVLAVTHANILIHDDFRHAFQGHHSAKLSQHGITQPSTNTGDMVSSCKEGLEDLLKALKQCEIGHRLGWERIKAAFYAKDIRCTIENFIATTYHEVKAVRTEQQDWRQEEKDKALLNWLSDISFEDMQRAVLAKRHPDTGQWFLDMDEFKEWRDGQSGIPSALWCPGMPGAGKTVMSSVVIDHLRQRFDDSTVGIAFARLLLDNGADPNGEVQSRRKGRRQGTVPLANAARKGHIGVVQMLLGVEGIQVNKNYGQRMTPYYWALRSGHLDVARLLRSHGGTF